MSSKSLIFCHNNLLVSGTGDVLLLFGDKLDLTLLFLDTPHAIEGASN